MLIKLFKCQMCGHQFEVEVIDRDDPREERRRGFPVTCEKCGSPRLEPVRTRRKAC